MIVCLCHNVSEEKILKCIDDGARSIVDIGEACEAGTDCGSCLNVIKELLFNYRRGLDMSEQFEFFWSGPFSQWYPSKFKVAKITFNCAEQLMMFCKAVSHDDIKMATKIMKSNSPKEQKAMGRKVKGFNVGSWAMVARDIVYVGSYAKYMQDEKLKKILLSTEGKTLVESSPYDKIWGIGLGAGDERAQQRATWQGKNWLGAVLTQVRDDIVNNNHNTSAFKLVEEIIDRYRKNK